MRANEYRYQVTIKRSTGTPDSYGFTASVWSNVSVSRCARTVQNSRKALASGEVWYPAAATFTFRIGTDIKNGDRIQDGDNLYDVVSVVSDRKLREITVNAELHNE